MRIIKQINENVFYYNLYKRKKKNGKFRTITAPNLPLKKIQKDFSLLFESKTRDIFGDYITGFRRGFSINDNAKIHLGKPWIINLDIKDFFPSITRDILRDTLEEINLTKMKSYNKEFLIEALTLNKILPQGSPASPVLANYIAIKKIDKIVFDFIKELDFEYTRYADDLTLSTNKKYSRNELKDLINLLIQKIEKNNIFKIAKDKIKLSNQGQRQEVTGIVVNKQYSIKRKERMKLRAAIHQINIGKQIMTPQLYGKLSFINQVNPDLFKKLTKELKV